MLLKKKKKQNLLIFRLFYHSEAGATASCSRISGKNDLSMQKKEKGVTGLRNLGNTCYMSAVIQCLSCTTPIVEYFFSWQFEKFIAR